MYAWLIWLIASTFYLYEFIHRLIPSIMIPEMLLAFDISYTTFANMAAMYFFVYGITQVPVGFIFDKYGTRLPLTFAALLVSVGSFTFSLAHSPLLAFTSRAIVALGSAFAFIGCLKIGTQWFHVRKFGLIVGLTSFVGISGTFFVMQPIASAIDASGWRQIMQVMGLTGLAITFLIWGLVQSKYPDTPKDIKQNLQDVIIKVIKNYRLWIIAIIGSLMVMPIIIYAETWGVAFLMSKYSIKKPLATIITSYTFIGIGLGGPVIGWFSDLIGSRKLMLILGNLIMITVVMLIIYLPFLATVNDLKVLHLLLGVGASSMLLCFSLNSEIVEPNMRGTAIGLTNTVVTATSVSFHPLIGWIINAISKTNTEAVGVSTFNKSFLPLVFGLCIALILCIFLKLPTKK